ncbi:MAG: HAD family hydrolase [Planctomycetota bacterium]
MTDSVVEAVSVAASVAVSDSVSVTVSGSVTVSVTVTVPGSVTGPYLVALSDIQLLVLDVDGVLTDGSIWLAPSGEEVKPFFVRDGAAIRWLLESGLRAALVTGRSSETVRRRASELGIERVTMGATDKGRAFDELLEREGLEPRQVAYMGDDLADLPAMTRAGFAFTVPDAPPEVRQRAHHVTTAAAGRGAVREAIELLLRAHGLWDALVGGYLT